MHVDPSQKAYDLVETKTCQCCLILINTLNLERCENDKYYKHFTFILMFQEISHKS